MRAAPKLGLSLSREAREVVAVLLGRGFYGNRSARFDIRGESRHQSS